MIKRKGQIVPKYLVKAIQKKSQHLVKFGSDVECSIRSRLVLRLQAMLKSLRFMADKKRAHS